MMLQRSTPTTGRRRGRSESVSRNRRPWIADRRQWQTEVKMKEGRKEADGATSKYVFVRLKFQFILQASRSIRGILSQR